MTMNDKCVSIMPNVTKESELQNCLHLLPFNLSSNTTLPYINAKVMAKLPYRQTVIL
jgi:hypothetical protein